MAARNLQFLKDLIGHAGDDCVTWPFGRNEYGYGQVKFGDKIRKAHRVMCILAHGEPPEPRYNAAHSCGNGKHGCVNPRHLSWKTPSENTMDTVVAGRSPKKKGEPRAKLTAELAEEIRQRGSEGRWALAEEYGVGPETVRRILKGEIWLGKPADHTRRFDPGVRDRLVRDAKRLRGRGASLESIAKQIGVSRATARNFVSE